MGNKIILTNEQLKHLTQTYKSGTSVKNLAKSLGLCCKTINRILKSEGIQPRGRSEAERLKWKEIKKDQAKIDRQCGNAWIATIDREHSDKEKIQRALTKYKNQTHINKGESAIAAKLWKSGFEIEQQYPEYAYNIDIAIPAFRIAVEVVGNNWKPHQIEYHHKRMKHLLENDWVVVNVFTWCKEAGLLRLKNSDNTFAQSVRTLPTFTPERIADYICKLKTRIEKGEEIHGRYVIISGNGIVLSAAYKKAMFFSGLPCLPDSHGHTFGLLPQKYEKLKNFLA